MNERIKILELIQEGKLTIEQADTLLAALESHNKSIRQGPFTYIDPDNTHYSEMPNTNQNKRNGPTKVIDKKLLDDLKSIGTNVTAALSQSFGEMKRSLEQEFDHWSSNSSHTVSVTTEINLPASMQNISVHSKNGRIQATVWEEPFARIQVRGQVKTSNLNEAKQLLEQALQADQTNTEYNLTVADHHDVTGTQFDLFVPRGLINLVLKTQNGRVHVESIEAVQLRAESKNGALSIYDASVIELFLTTDNGAIEVERSVHSMCRTVDARTKNGKIVIEGISDQLEVSGVAKTSAGRVDISGESFTLQFEDNHRKNSAHFNRPSKQSTDGAMLEVGINCETRNGKIRILEGSISE